MQPPPGCPSCLADPPSGECRACGSTPASRVESHRAAIRDTAAKQSLNEHDRTAQAILPNLVERIRRIEGTENQWLRWNGIYWEEARNDLPLRTAVLDELRRHRRGQETDISNTARKAVTEYVALDETRMPVPVSSLNARGMELNTPGGIVCLKTGEIRPSDRESFHTRATATTPAASASAPIWSRFISEVTRGDEELAHYLQKLAGYCLTGTIREHTLTFIYGAGGNGKGVFLNTLSLVMGDYATAAPLTAFTQSGGDSHPTVLAGLMGARLVISTETGAGTSWDSQKVKAVTSGDPMRTRLMRQDYIEVDPHFKLVVSGNHPPEIDRVDDAWRRRLNIVPFTFKPEEPDVDLPEKLEAEYPAILRWAIDGCILWHREGLEPPEAVQAMTDEFLNEQEPARTWLKERCEVHPDGRVSRQALYDDWRIWCSQNGEQPGSKRTFKTLLKPHIAELPVKDRQVGEARLEGYWGLRLRDGGEL